MTAGNWPSQARAESFAHELPPVCEVADSPEVVFRDAADQPCGGNGSWLLVNGDDPPSPLCGKHADLIRERLGDDLPYGARLVPA